MVLFQYGQFGYACAQIPSTAACNLFYRQILEIQPIVDQSFLLGDSTGVGVRPTCAIAQVGNDSVGNVALIAAAGISALFALSLSFLAGGRQAAVGRAEMRFLFLLYGLCCVFELLDVGAFLTNGTTALTWITGIHTGLLVGTFWCLAWLAFLSLQVVEDGTWTSIVPFFIGLIILVVGSTYIALDTAFSVSGYFNANPITLNNAWLFSLVIVWPLASASFYLVVNLIVVTTVLREIKPIFLFLGTAICFALGQGARFALSHRICSGTDARIDGSFVAVILETISAGLLFLAWKSITEDHWQPDDYVDYVPGSQVQTGRGTTLMDEEQYPHESMSQTERYNPYDDYAEPQTAQRYAEHDISYPTSETGYIHPGEARAYQSDVGYRRSAAPESISHYSHTSY